MRNYIGDYYSTLFEISAGTAQHIPIFSISSDISYNLFQIERIFRHFKTNALDERNSNIKNINLLFGLSYGFNGFSVNIGIELAGFTVKCPILFTSEFPEEEDMHIIDKKSLICIGVVATLFLGATYLLRKMTNKKKKDKKKFLQKE
jgi:hypothetical protein